MQLRVRSLCGAELVLDVPHHSVRVRVAEIKRHAVTLLLRLRDQEVRQQKQEKQTQEEDEETKESDPPMQDDDDVVIVDNGKTDTKQQQQMGSTEAMAVQSCFLVFRGKILADADDVNLFALAPSDFFVLVEEHVDDHNDGNTTDNSDGDMLTKSETGNSTIHSNKRRKLANTETSTSAPDMLIQSTHDNATLAQLVEMGFAADQAQNALTLTNGQLARAMALLMGEDDGHVQEQQAATATNLRGFVDELITHYPELKVIKSIFMDEKIHIWKKRSWTNSFDALVLLKEGFLPAHFVTQLNANAMATVMFLSLPQHFDPSSSHPHRGHRPLPAPPPIDATARPQAFAIDLTDDAFGDADGGGSAQEAIERVRTVYDYLVVAVYPSKMQLTCITIANCLLYVITVAHFHGVPTGSCDSDLRLVRRK